MEDILETKLGKDQILQGLISASPKIKMDSEKKIELFLKRINNENKTVETIANKDKESVLNIQSEDVFEERGEYAANELASIYFDGVQYFDLKNVYFINNTGIANLIDLLKLLLKQGVVIKFVNVREKIKNKFKSMGLDHIFDCS